MKEIYNDYIEKYKQLTYNEKREEILEKIRDMIEVLGNFTNFNDDLINREIIDLKQNTINEDDYLEGLFVYLNILEDLIANSIINFQEQR